MSSAYLYKKRTSAIREYVFVFYIGEHSVLYAETTDGDNIFNDISRIEEGLDSEFLISETKRLFEESYEFVANIKVER